MTKLSHDLYVDGVTVIPNIFDDVQLRFLAGLHKDEDDGQNFFSRLPEDLKSLITSRVVALLNKTYGSHGWKYTGESSIFYKNNSEIRNIKNNSTKLHRDIRGLGSLYPLTSKDDSLVRVGIYLQDTYHASYGTKFILRSHSSPVLFCDWLVNIKCFLKFQISLRHLFFDFGLSRLFSSRNVPTHIGDMIIWSSRTLHSACYKRLKAIPSISLPPALERWLPERLFLTLASPRSVLFFGFYLEGSTVAEDYILQRKDVGAI